jgi:hypothetical protein
MLLQYDDRMGEGESLIPRYTRVNETNAETNAEINESRSNTA